MRKLLLLMILLISSPCLASDTHSSDENHRVTYTITDGSGNPVTGQTVRLAVERSSDGFFLDFNDNTFKNSGWTTRLVVMQYDPMGEHYYRVLSIDQAVRVSNDFACIISNDDATYGDQQVEVIEFSNIKNLIKMSR